MSDDVLSEWDATVAKPAAPRTPAKLPPAAHADAVRVPTEGLRKWLEERRISEDTVAAFGLYTLPHHFQADPAAGPLTAIVFPYRAADGSLVNRGYRHPRGLATEYEAAAETLFNVGSIDATDPQEIVWAQRELDVMALHEAGFPNATCLPQVPGPAPRIDPSDPEEEDRRMVALQTHQDMLAAAKKIILALDDTPAGTDLREELARRLGRHRCAIARWPDGCKTAGAVLRHLGKEALSQAIFEAEPYPIEGIHRIGPNTLLDLLAAPPPPTMGTGIGVLDAKLAIPMDGRLITVTGIPNHGKTPFVRHLMMHQMEHHDRRWAVFSPEMRPWSRFVASCASWLTSKAFQPSKATGGLLTMTKDEVVFATNWLRRRLVMIVGDAEREMPTIDWLFEKAKACVLVDGCTDLWIDPWNELAHVRGTAREDEYLRETLMRCLAFGNRYGVNLWVNVHPITLRPAKPGEAVQAPGPYDIAGGAMWFNKSDMVLVVHRPAGKSVSEIYVRKSKDPAWARRGDMVEIAYDVVTGRYSTPTG